MDKDSSTQANASEKPQRSGNTQSTEPAKPGSPLVKQRKVIPGATEGDATGVRGTTTARAALAGEAAEAHYDKVRRLPVVFRVEHLSWCSGTCSLGVITCNYIQFCLWPFNGSSFHSSRADKNHHHHHV